MSKKSRTQSRAEKAAEIKAAQARRERKRRLLAIGGVVGAMVLIVGGAVLISALNREDVEPADVGASEYGFVYGPDEADHTVVIYEDFLCPHCGTLEAAAGEDLAEQADQGAVRIDYRPVAFLGEESVRTLNAFKVVLEESGPDVAKEYHDALFAEQASAPLADDQLVELAVESGAEEGAVRGGIEDMAQEDWVTEATEAAAADGLQGTPTVQLDGETFDDGSSWQEIGANLVAAVQE
ncbi:DsbA family protein [Nocardioides panacisoli]|uniref:DsbA family protein n=1 Tax=Nocardioides panacisoli TaxID=627624 RepID=UPI001C638EDC|nr:thioredoxin domain-containing protein [Nocardioides panacisoli]QYJ04315.1 DsbA family protein [Nocardioides panacisoli]